MSLKLIFRDDEKDDEFDRRIVERIEFNPTGRATEGGDNFIDAIGGSVRNSDAEPNARAHRFFPLLEQSQDAVSVFRLDFAETGEQVDQFDDGGPTLGGFHLRDDLLVG